MQIIYNGYEIKKYESFGDKTFRFWYYGRVIEVEVKNFKDQTYNIRCSVRRSKNYPLRGVSCNLSVGKHSVVLKMGDSILLDSSKKVNFYVNVKLDSIELNLMGDFNSRDLKDKVKIFVQNLLLKEQRSYNYRWDFKTVNHE